MRALCQLPAKLRILEAFLSFAAAKKGNLTQSRKATKWRASTARFIQTPDNDDRKPFFLWGFVALCETNPPRFTRPIRSDALRAMAAL